RAALRGGSFVFGQVRLADEARWCSGGRRRQVRCTALASVKENPRRSPPRYNPGREDLPDEGAIRLPACKAGGWNSGCLRRPANLVERLRDACADVRQNAGAPFLANGPSVPDAMSLLPGGHRLRAAHALFPARGEYDGANQLAGRESPRRSGSMMQVERFE